MRYNLYVNRRYSVLKSPDIEKRIYTQEPETVWERQLDPKQGISWKPIGGYKPTGLWYAFGRGWIDHYIAFKDIPDHLLFPIFELNVDIKNILILSTPKDIIEFNDVFKTKTDITLNTINWSRVANNYSGIEVNPFNKDFTSLDWYQTFEISSGCIWNMDALRIHRRLGDHDKTY